MPLVFYKLGYEKYHIRRVWIRVSDEIIYYRVSLRCPRLWTLERGYNSFCLLQIFLESLLCHEELLRNFHDVIYKASQTLLTP